ncbi:MAG: ATP-dependent protease ATPase subunit HslU, partial [Gemmatimonadetes bacterium]|nr:ATP-dependent protease ATPase subunit HslU [Gemmatimonadota bacterium]
MTDPNVKVPDPLPWLEEMPPRQIVAELDRYIIGQGAAKKAVAIAIRNRWRRMQTPESIRDEITPYNIIMIGPTGVGKTEVARRLARLAGAPFLKVEASKFTEVGYVGRDVESMIRELVDVAITMVRTEREDDVWPQAEEKAEARLLDLLLPAPPEVGTGAGAGAQGRSGAEEGDAEKGRRAKAREKLQADLKEGKLDDREVEVELAPQNYPNPDWGAPPEGSQDPGFNMGEWLQEMLPKRKKRRVVKVPDARRIILDEELRKMVDMDDVVNEALDRVENHGIVFIDEIDKIAGERSTTGPDISREGVQRDLLPIVEGSTVQTRYGYIRTDHILFIAAGAFHVSKPSDLIPELQGRFPI